MIESIPATPTPNKIQNRPTRTTSKHQKLTFRQHNTNTNTPTHATLILHATRSTVCKEDNTSATVIRSIPATPKLVEIKIRSTRTASQHQNPRSVSTTQIPLVMLFQATRQMASEEDNTSATHVAHLHHDRKHTCNAEARRNEEPVDKDHLKTPKSTFRLHNTNTPCHAISSYQTNG